MSFAVFKGEATIKDLVSRLFGISGKGSQAKADQAAKALLDANPQLKDISKVLPGSIVKVPATAPPLKPSELATTSQIDRSAIAAQAQQTLDAIEQRQARMEARASDSANAFVTTAKSDQAQVLLHTAPPLKQKLLNLISDAQSMVSAAKTEQASRAQALSGVRARLLNFVNAGQSRSL